MGQRFARIQIDGTEEGFEAVGKSGSAGAAAGSFLAFAHHEVLAKIDLGSVAGKCGTGDEAGAQLGEVPLIEIGEPVEELVGEDQLDHGVAEKFEPLVIEVRLVGLVGEARVGERFGQEERITKLVSDAFFEGPHNTADAEMG